METGHGDLYEIRRESNIRGSGEMKVIGYLFVLVAINTELIHQAVQTKNEAP
jgi:hypothetical protein